MLIGYARVSTPDQKLDLQKDALTKAGWEKIHEDYDSGTKTDRNRLEDAIKSLRKRDTLVVSILRKTQLTTSAKSLVFLERRCIGI
ncbi:MAG: recombinase family protein [Candidatus Marinimicrobia bacterium]|nr:recombinase family protein [Candidatus Neomarinimicrobiota bacterium]MCH8068166.1 recombinase family protein [Candidatus Neomarinimicrobiota bacterium]